jgi:HEXXH motif-containing protein
MTLQPHRLPEAMLTALAAGAGGPQAMRALADIQLSRNRMFARTIVELARRTGHPQAGEAGEAYRLLAEVEQVAPAAVRDVLCYPTVAAWMSGTASLLRGTTSGSAPNPGWLGSVVAAAAVRARLPIRIPSYHAPVRGAALVLPSLGTATLPAEGTLDIRVHADGVTLARGGHRLHLPTEADPEADLEDGAEDGAEGGAAAGSGTCPPGWAGLPRILAGSGNLRVDARLDGPSWEVLPGGSLDARILTTPGALDTELWRRRIGAGWRLLARHHTEVADEAALMVRAFVPLLAAPDGGMVSGTFRSAYGAVAMSLPPDARVVALTLAHELQHAKLVAVMDSFALVTPGPEQLFYAPWRSDLRPLGALLHGAYAHVGVAAFWRTQQRVEETAEDVFEAQVAFARWRSAAWAATDAVLGTGRLTPMGELMVDGMRATLRRFLAEPVPEAALGQAERVARSHLRRSAASR